MTYTYLHVYAVEGGGSFAERGTLKPHPFTGYWFPISPIMARARLSFFLLRYTCWTPNARVEVWKIEIDRQSEWILHARRDLTRFFSPFLPFFSRFHSLLFRSLRTSRGECDPRSTFAHRKPSTTAKGPCLWRVWGKADINVAGTRFEPRETGVGRATCKRVPSISFSCLYRYPGYLIIRNERLKREERRFSRIAPKLKCREKYN